MPSRRKPAKPAPVPAPAKMPPAPAWLRPVILGLSAFLLLAWLSPQAGDSDSWWHLKTGQFLIRQHRLPVPDPFAYTTYFHSPSHPGPAYPGEETTRDFNLTMEWLADVALYAAFAAAGLAGLVLMRAAALSLFSALAGLMVYRRTHGFYRALAATLAVAFVAHHFTGDRPQYFTFVFFALTLNLLDARRALWLLPPLFLVWANCHAGFFLGWVLIAIYCAEGLYRRWRGPWPQGERRLWIAGIAAIAVSGINPNGFRVFEVLRNYRHSPLMSQVWEWQRPALLELSPFTVLLCGGLLVLLWNRRQARLADWLLFAAFGAAGILAFRNIIFTCFVGAFLVAAYVPARSKARRGVPWPLLEYAAAALLLAAAGLLIGQGRAFQFHAYGRTPVGAADFLARHHVEGRLFNTYGQGGYLIWRLWPQMPVFLDGRMLNESVAQDAQRILFAADDTGGKSAQELLEAYGIDVIVMDCFEPVSGAAYYLPILLSDPNQTEWKLVYRDDHDLIYMRRPAPGVEPMPLLDGLAGMEEQCFFLMSDGAPACTKGMLDVFTLTGDHDRARKWAYIRQAAHLE